MPVIRAAAPDTFVIADGISCKTRIQDSDTGATPLHLARPMRRAREHARGAAPSAGTGGARPPAPLTRTVLRTGADRHGRPGRGSVGAHGGTPVGNKPRN